MKAQSLLAYYPNGTQFSRTPSRLTWTDDDRLVLERVDEAGTATETFFDAPVAEVRISGAMSVPKFTVGGRGYRVDFAEAARIAGSLSGIAGGVLGSDAARGGQIGIYAGGTAASGVQPLMAGLKAAGAQSSYWTTGKVVGVAGIATVAIVVVVTIVVLVGSALSL